MFSRRSAISALAATLAFPAVARSSEWPAKTVTFVVPFPPGGFTDVIARVVAQALQGSVDQPVVVLNRPGAGGTIGAGFVAQSAPDGHTLLITSHALVYSSLAFRKGGLNIVESFKPIISFGSSTGFLVTGNPSGITSFQDLIEKAQRNPKKHTLATVGGSSGPFPVLLKSVHAELTLVPFQGNAAAIPAVIRGDVDLMVASPDTIGSFVANGTMKVLANISSRTRSPLYYPDAPVLTEFFSGELSDKLIGDGFIGLTAPIATPDAIVDQINAKVAERLRNDENLRDKFGKAALTVEANTSRAHMATLIERELVRSRTLLELSGEYVN